MGGVMMLLEFSGENYRSIRDLATLSMVATKLKSPSEEVDAGTVLRLPDGRRILRSAVMVGPNGSGKSNLFLAFVAMNTMVVSSARDGQKGDPLPVSAFALDAEAREAPTYMEVVFVHEGVQYRYGFRATAAEVKEEWLYRRPAARERMLFRRVGKDVELSGEFREGRGLAERTRNNALFLSVAAQFDGAVASAVLGWFEDVVRCVGDFSWRSMREFTTGCLTEDAASPVASRIQALLRAGDLGIAEVKVDREDLGVDVVRQDPSIRSRPVRVVHEAKTPAGDLVRAEFDLRRESSGTQKLFALSGPVADALDGGRVFWVDELEAALHPSMTRALVDLFHDPSTNPKNAQLLFSSHDATLLSPLRFRRDQIWFVDKDRTGATSLVSLAEYRGVREDEDFMRSYLGGRFGALPFLGGMREAVRGEKE